MKFPLPEIRHNQTGFATLARLYFSTQECFLEDIEIDMRSTSWFDADMCAAFGAILYRLESNLNTVNLVNICPSVEEILSKNRFLNHYSRIGNTPDHWGTTIPYHRFNIGDGLYFLDYIVNEFSNQPELPKMSPGLFRKFCESIFEIFSNAAQHSDTELGVFSCGQFFPKRNELNFMVVDLGIGMREKVRRHLKSDITPEGAIEWATQERNTTRHSDIPGGLGLTLLREFISLNGGRIQIISDTGYWYREDRRAVAKRLDNPFPGTAVSITINTSDTNSYRLSSESQTDDIF